MDSMQKLFESVEACASRLDYLNNRYAHLASDATHESVKTWRRVRDGLLLRHADAEQAQAPAPDIKAQATELLTKQGRTLEEVIDILRTEHGVEVDISDLIQRVGKAVYITALRRDAVKLQNDRVSFSQIAKRWNEQGRPSLDDESWTASTVSILIE